MQKQGLASVAKRWRGNRGHWTKGWLIGLGACTAMPLWANPQPQQVEPEPVEVRNVALEETGALFLARLPQGAASEPERFLIAGAQPGQALRLTLTLAAQPERVWPLAALWADGEGRAQVTLPAPRAQANYRVQLWSSSRTASAPLGTFWLGPQLTFRSGLGAAAQSSGDSVSEAVPEQAGGMIVTEIMKDPSAVSDTNGEWIELFNPIWMRQNIEGWTLSDDGGSSTILTNGGAGIWVAGRGFRVLARKTDPNVNGGVTDAYGYNGFTLSNGSDQVRLARPDGTLVDRVGYDDGDRWPDVSGASLQLEPDIESPYTNDQPGRWCSGMSPFGLGDMGTPGSANEDC